MPIYDISYRRIAGVREPARLRCLPIAAAGLRLFFRRRIPKILGLVALLPFFGMVVFLAGPHLMSQFRPESFPAETAAIFHLTGTGLYLYIGQMEWIFLFLFTVLAGGGLIANDLRANALEIYFSRPLTLRDYFLGKLLVVVLVLLALTLLPGVLLWIVDATLADQDGHWIDLLPLLPRLAAASLLVAVPYGVLMLGISALARTARNAMLVFAGLVMMSGLLAAILEDALDQPAYGLLSVNQSILRLVALALAPDPDLVRPLSPFGEGVPLLDLPVAAPALVLGAWLAVALAVFFRKVRGVEVVASG